MRQFVLAIDNGKNLESYAKSVTVLKAIFLIKRSLFLISPQTITSCFKKAGFVIEREIQVNSASERNEVDALSEEFRSSLSIEDFDSFLDMDANLECFGLLADSEICEEVFSNENAEADIDVFEYPSQFPVPPSSHQALQKIKKLRSHFANHEDFVLKRDTMETHIVSKSNKLIQTKITGFFQLMFWKVFKSFLSHLG